MSMSKDEIQAIFDSIADSDRVTRSQYHVTLRQMLSAIGQAEHALVSFQTEDGRQWGAGDAISYRGYYSDLAIEPMAELSSTGDLMMTLMAVQGNTLEGYKGGDYLMDDDTPVWLASYGSASGHAVVRWQIQQTPEGANLLVFYTKQV